MPRHEIAEVAANSPGIAAAMVRLYQSYLARKRLTELGVFDRNDGLPEAANVSTPSDWVRNYIQSEKNYFAELEESRGDVCRGAKRRHHTALPQRRNDG